MFLLKKVLESFYGECTPINYISGSAKKQYPYRFEEALSAQFQIRSRKETSFSMSTKTPILFLIIILENTIQFRKCYEKWRIATYWRTK